MHFHPLALEATSWAGCSLSCSGRCRPPNLLFALHARGRSKTIGFAHAAAQPSVESLMCATRDGDGAGPHGVWTRWGPGRVSKLGRCAAGFHPRRVQTKGHYHEVGQRPSYTPSAAQPLTRVPNPSSLRASPTTPKKCPKNLIYDVNNKISSPTAPKTKPPYLGCPKQSSVVLKFPRGLRTPNYIDQMCRIRLGWLSTSYLSNFECSDMDTDRILNVLTRIRIGS